MEIKVTHVIEFSEDAKRFLSGLLQRGIQSAEIVAATNLKAAEAPDDDTPAGAAVAEREKKVPPGIACTKIGQDTAASIMALLPADIETVEKAIKRKRFDAEALLKLLWERGKIGYDGEVYHHV